MESMNICEIDEYLHSVALNRRIGALGAASFLQLDPAIVNKFESAMWNDLLTSVYGDLHGFVQHELFSR